MRHERSAGRRRRLLFETLMPRWLLTTFMDDFNDNVISSNWQQFTIGTGISIAEQQQRLEINLEAAAADDPATGVFQAGYDSLFSLRGDFDVQVDFDLPVFPSGNGTRIGLVASDIGIVERISFSSQEYIGQPWDGYLTHFADGVQGITQAADTTGKLRLVRQGNVVSGYYHNGDWILLHDSTTSTAPDVSLQIAAWSHESVFTDVPVTVTFDNFTVVEGELVDRVPEDPEPDPDRNLGINRWWAAVDENQISVDWAVNIPREANYRFDIDIEGIVNTWDLADDATLKLDGVTVGEFDFFGSIDVGVIAPGSHTFTVDSFVVPDAAFVEGVTFELFDLTIPALEQELEALFIADWPQQELSGQLNVDGSMIPFSTTQELVDRLAPATFFEKGEEYFPVNVDSLLADLESRNGSTISEVPRGDRNHALDLSPYDDPVNVPTDPVIYASVLVCQERHINCVPDRDIAINYYIVSARSNWSDFGGLNEHEGDGEVAIVYASRDGSGIYRPTDIAVAQHLSSFNTDGGDKIAWDVAEKSGSHPHVYVALGSHATFVNAGSTWIRTGFTTDHLDVHTGGGTAAQYPVILLDRFSSTGSTPDWFEYPGRWGNPDLFGNAQVGDEAPRGPAFASTDSFQINPGQRYVDPWRWASNFSRINHTDADGVRDDVESRAPNFGDGNNDNVLDWQQATVASLPSMLGANQYVSLVTDDGTFGGVYFAPADNVPTGVSLEAGAFNYEVTDLAPGAHFAVTYILPSGYTPNSMFAQDTAGNWTQFLYDPTTDTGAQFNPSDTRITVRYVDGGRGDLDGQANGMITARVGPAVAQMLPVSNVQVLMNNGHVRLVGDDNGNRLTITQFGGSGTTYQITPESGTTLNGSSGPLIVNNVTRGMTIDLGNGSDSLRVRDLVFTGLLWITTGDGDDDVSFFNSSFLGNLYVNTGDGDDTFSALDAVIAQIFFLDVGVGNDSASFTNSNLNGTGFFIGRAGSDELDIRSLTVSGTIAHFSFEMLL